MPSPAECDSESEEALRAAGSRDRLLRPPEPMPIQDVVDESDGETEEHPVANLPKRERKFKYRGTTLNHKQYCASVKEIQR